MFVFLFLALSLALCQSEPLGKLVERADQDQVEDSPWWSEKEERKDVEKGNNKHCKLLGTTCRKTYGGECHDPDEQIDCDFSLNGLCHSRDCQCCINCDTLEEDSSCQMADGKCRKVLECNDNHCMPNEYHDVLESCGSPKCGCCQNCTNLVGCTSGTCIGDVMYMLSLDEGYYVEEEEYCDQSECTCMKQNPAVDCPNGKVCSIYGDGPCIPNGESCQNGSVLVESCGCDGSTTCGCCVPASFVLTYISVAKCQNGTIT